MSASPSRRVIGLALGIVGVYFIIGGVHGSDMMTGIILSLISVLLWSYVSIIIRKIGHKYHPLIITTPGAWASALVFTLPSLRRGTHAHARRLWDAGVAASLLYMAVMCTLRRPPALE